MEIDMCHVTWWLVSFGYGKTDLVVKDETGSRNVDINNGGGLCIQGLKSSRWAPPRTTLVWPRGCDYRLMASTVLAGCQLGHLLCGYSHRCDNRSDCSATYRNGHSAGVLILPWLVSPQRHMEFLARCQHESSASSTVQDLQICIHHARWYPMLCCLFTP